MGHHKPPIQNASSEVLPDGAPGAFAALHAGDHHPGEGPGSGIPQPSKASECPASASERVKSEETRCAFLFMSFI